MGRAVEEKNGAKATIPLTLTRASVIAHKKLLHSISFPCGIGLSLLLGSIGCGKIRFFESAQLYRLLINPLL
jgi:hypothetical protein